jgi:hypothetical protein
MTEAFAVLFDQVAYKAWLGQPTKTPEGECSKYDAIPELGDGWQRHDGNGGWLASVVLEALRNEPQVWSYGEGVGDLKVWPTEAPESGPDGGLTGEITVNGVPLSLGHIPADELIPTDQDMLPAYEAAELALATLSDRIDVAYRQLHRSGAGRPMGDLFIGPYGPLTGADIQVALTTLAELFDTGSLETLSEPQLAMADRVLALWREDTAVDGEIVA